MMSNTETDVYTIAIILYGMQHVTFAINNNEHVAR